MELHGLKIKWLGHATFLITTPKGTNVLIDPWVMGNPACPENEKQLKKVDVMLVTHGHFDHIGDAVEIAKKHSSKVVCIPEMGAWLEKKGVKNVMGMNKGGTQHIGDIAVTMVHAVHSCGITDGDQIVYGGEACGYVVAFDNGIKIYHAGDTMAFSDMKIIHELWRPQIAMLPIGDHYTMDPRQAAYAAELLQPKTVIPMHFGTFPVLTGRPGELAKWAEGCEVREMKPGETVS